MIVPHPGQTEIGCFKIKARSNPSGVLHEGQGNDIFLYYIPKQIKKFTKGSFFLRR